MLTLPTWDLNQEYNEEFLRLYMPSYLSIKNMRCVKMRTTTNDIEFYCCNKCKEQFRITFTPNKEKFIMKQYLSSPKSACILSGEQGVLNYYLNLIEIYYPIIKQFIQQNHLEMVSANKILKIYSEKKLLSKRTFIDIIEDVKKPTKDKISKKWSNLITKYRRDSNLKIIDERENINSKSYQPKKTLACNKSQQPNIKLQPRIEPIIRISPMSHQTKPRNSVSSVEGAQMVFLHDLYQQKQEEHQCQISDKDSQMDIGAFTSNWDQPQKNLKIKTMNIDESLPKFLIPKNGLMIPQIKNPSLESAYFAQKILDS